MNRKTFLNVSYKWRLPLNHKITMIGFNQHEVNCIKTALITAKGVFRHNQNEHGSHCHWRQGVDHDNPPALCPAIQAWCGVSSPTTDSTPSEGTCGGTERTTCWTMTTSCSEGRFYATRRLPTAWWYTQVQHGGHIGPHLRYSRPAIC